MTNYETMVLIAPTLAPEAADRLIGSFEEIITGGGGTVNKVDKWGRRTLAYEIQDFKEGIYAVYDYSAPGELIKELQRRLRLNDSVLRFLTTRRERKDRLEAKGSERRQAKQERSKRRSSRGTDRDDR